MGSREGTSAAADPEPEPADNAVTFDCSLPVRHSVSHLYGDFKLPKEMVEQIYVCF